MSMFELYNKIGADYQVAQSRLGNEKIIERFIKRFVEDKTFESLKAAYASDDEAVIYQEICTFMEVCGSLSLNRLAETAGVIMDAYRPENTSIRDAFHVADLFDTLFEQYDSTLAEMKKALDINE